MDHQINGHDQINDMNYSSTSQYDTSSYDPPTQYDGNLSQNLSQIETHQLAYQQVQQQREQNLRQQLLALWAKQCKDSEKTTDFKNHSLPLARIKKIMKADEDVRMISAEAPIVFARACEMFIVDLTLRSWNHTEDTKRRTLQRNDIADAITTTEIFDFLVDIVPKEEDEGDGGAQDEASHNSTNFVSLAPPAPPPRGPMPLSAAYPSDLYGYCYMPPPPQSPQQGALDVTSFTNKAYEPYLPPMQMSTQAPQQSKSSSDS